MSKGALGPNSFAVLQIFLWDFAKDPLASLTITTSSAFLKLIRQSHRMFMNLFQRPQGQ